MCNIVRRGLHALSTAGDLLPSNVQVTSASEVIVAGCRPAPAVCGLLTANVVKPSENFAR